jgi:hypothetical protein
MHFAAWLPPLECLIIQGQVRYRLDPVLPQPGCTPIRLYEPVRRMAELTREEADAFVFNHWHEFLPLSPVDRYLLPRWTATAIAKP